MAKNENENGQEEVSKRSRMEVQLYTSEQVCRDNPPEAGGDKMKVLQVNAPDQKARFLWARDVSDAVQIVARQDGYVASSCGRLPTKEEVAASLARMSPEDRAILIAQYVKAGKK
jgi:hypothetical protein